jgi:5-methylcytosine-specific restriction endonuclease McrA
LFAVGPCYTTGMASKKPKRKPQLRRPPSRPRTAPLRLGEKPGTAHKSETPAAALKRLASEWTPELGATLRAMPYTHFLRTEYWATVRRAVLSRQRGRCVVCGTTRRVQVHHRTYLHHGAEHAHLADLVGLCGDCHTIYHRAGKLAHKKPPAP